MIFFLADDQEGEADWGNPAEPEAVQSEEDDHTPESFEYLTAEVRMPRGAEVVRGTVTNRATGDNGLSLGKRNSNPILDTREYKVQFPDGATETFAANAIAENMYS